MTAADDERPDFSPSNLTPFIGGPDTLTKGINRDKFAAELAANPALREKVLAISLNENGNPDANRAVMESLMNRADLYGKSLASQAKWTSEGGYYDDKSDNHSRALRSLQDPKLRAMAEDNLNAVLGGSNVSNYATDNASGAWGWNRMHGMFGLDHSSGGEYFGHPVSSDASGWKTYPAWRDNVGGGNLTPNNSLPTSESDQLTAALSDRQQLAAPANAAVASAVQGATPSVSAEPAAGADQPQGFFGSIAGAAKDLGITSPTDQTPGNQANSIWTKDDEKADDKAAQAAYQATVDASQRAAAAAGQFMQPKPLDMSRIAAVIQRLQGPMGAGVSNGLGADQQQPQLGSGGYFGSIG